MKRKFYVARNSDGSLCAFNMKPVKRNYDWVLPPVAEAMGLGHRVEIKGANVATAPEFAEFSNIMWGDEPVLHTVEIPDEMDMELERRRHDLAARIYERTAPSATPAARIEVARIAIGMANLFEYVYNDDTLWDK